MKHLVYFALASVLPATLTVMLPTVSCAQNHQDGQDGQGMVETPYDNSVISDFDLLRYLGTWYEIARFDHSFERGLENVMAEYVLREDGMVGVTNTGWKDGKYKVAEGKARQPDPAGDPARLQVSFFLFFYSDYDILMLDEDYQYALVGSKSPKYLWILSRTHELSDAVLDMILEEASGRGYNIDNLIWVDQSANAAGF